MVISLTSIIETSSENHSGNQLWRAACFAVKPKVYLYLISTTMPMGSQIKQKAFHKLHVVECDQRVISLYLFGPIGVIQLSRKLMS